MTARIPHAIRPRLSRRSAPPRGFALVAVMWVILVAGLLLLGASKAVQADLSMARNELECVRAHWLARAGVEQAMAVLADDDGDVDGAWDSWYDEPSLFERIELLGGAVSVVAPPGANDETGEGRFGLIDLSGRLNINEAGGEAIQAVGDLLDWQTAAILDWRDQDNQARPGGAESAYYAGLTFPRLVRNGPMRTIGELRLIKDIDGEAFRGEDVNNNGLLDEHENDLSRSWPDDDGDGELLVGLRGQTTVYAYEHNRDGTGSERVNVNTVDAQKLQSRFNFTKALAEGVVAYGSSSGTNKTNASGGKKAKARFGSLMDLLKVKPKKQKSSSGDSEEGKVKTITLSWLADHLDALTLSDDERLPARVNVNTASREVLRTLPGMTDATVESILRRQDTGKGPFESVGELLSDKVFSEAQFKAAAEKVSVRSCVFEIRAEAVTRWGICHRIVAVVDRGANPMSVLYWYQSE